MIALSALAEWAGLWLNERAEVPRWVLTLVKCADYSLTPLAGATLVLQMRLKNRWRTALGIVLRVNGVFQIVAAFGGWMV